MLGRILLFAGSMMHHDGAFAGQFHQGNRARVFREGDVNGLSSPYVIQSPVPLSRRTRYGAVARGTFAPLRPDLAGGHGGPG
jgi:hypothetical protein